MLYFLRWYYILKVHIIFTFRSISWQQAKIMLHTSNIPSFNIASILCIVHSWNDVSNFSLIIYTSSKSERVQNLKIETVVTATVTGKFVCGLNASFAYVIGDLADKVLVVWKKKGYFPTNTVHLVLLGEIFTHHIYSNKISLLTVYYNEMISLLIFLFYIAWPLRI